MLGAFCQGSVTPNDDDFVTINLVELPVVRGSTLILCQAVFVVPSAKMREMENPRTLMMYHIMLCQTQDNIASGVTEKTNIGPEKFKNPEEEKRQENIEGTLPVKPSPKD